jgi:hypothetical protein
MQATGLSVKERTREAATIGCTNSARRSEPAGPAGCGGRSRWGLPRGSGVWGYLRA